MTAMLARAAMDGCALGGWRLPPGLRSAGLQGSNTRSRVDQRTAKWTAITDRLADTHGHFGALASQVEATDALAGRPPELHGMQEVRGSNPRSSTRQNIISEDPNPPVFSYVL
jgi:hypothetical protein